MHEETATRRPRRARRDGADTSSVKRQASADERRRRERRAPAKDDLERLMRYVEMEPNTGCWLWTGTVQSNHYGLFVHHVDGGRRHESAHRASYRLHHGPISKGLCVCHRCDQKLCVNPAHLFLGTHQDNMADLKRKGYRRQLRGEESPRAKLTLEKAQEIRRLVGEGHSHRSLARQFGVHYSQIYRVANRRRWT